MSSIRYYSRFISYTKNLLISNTDPFTRKTLTMEQINEYNKKPEIIEKIEQFKIKIKLFKNQNNLL